MDLCILLVTFSKNYYCWKKGISAIDKYTILIMSIPKRKKFDLFVFFLSRTVPPSLTVYSSEWKY